MTKKELELAISFKKNQSLEVNQRIKEFAKKYTLKKMLSIYENEYSTTTNTPGSGGFEFPDISAGRMQYNFPNQVKGNGIARFSNIFLTFYNFSGWRGNNLDDEVYQNEYELNDEDVIDIAPFSNKKNDDDSMPFKDMNSLKSYNEIVDKSYKLGCVMLSYHIPQWIDILSKINKEDLYIENDKYGLETEPHITLLYGIHCEETEDVEVKRIIEIFTPFEFQLTEISLFENEKFDVLIFKVYGDGLQYANEKLRELPHTNKYDTYIPHSTIAYLKKGTGLKYCKILDVPIFVESDTIVYSKDNDEKMFWNIA